MSEQPSFFENLPRCPHCNLANPLYLQGMVAALYTLSQGFLVSGETKVLNEAQEGVEFGEMLQFHLQVRQVTQRIVEGMREQSGIDFESPFGQGFIGALDLINKGLEV